MTKPCDLDPLINYKRMDSLKLLMKKVFVNGYGSIGSRIAQFIKDDPEIDL